MHGRHVVKIHRCDTPSIGETFTNAPLVSRVNMCFERPMVSSVGVHASSFSCAYNSFVTVGGCDSSFRNCQFGCRLVHCPVTVGLNIPFRCVFVLLSR